MVAVVYRCGLTGVSFFILLQKFFELEEELDEELAKTNQLKIEVIEIFLKFYQLY